MENEIMYHLTSQGDREELYLEVSKKCFEGYVRTVSNTTREEVARTLSHRRCMKTALNKLETHLQRVVPNGAKNHEVPSLRMVALYWINEMESGNITTCPITLAAAHEKYFQLFFRTLCKGIENHGVEF